MATVSVSGSSMYDHDTLARNFFNAMEWDVETGKPSRASLEVLGGMDDVIKDLYA